MQARGGPDRVPQRPPRRQGRSSSPSPTTTLRWPSKSRARIPLWPPRAACWCGSVPPAADATTAPGDARTGSTSPPGCRRQQALAPQAAAAANATNAKLAVGPGAGGYLCPDGRQLYVKSCYDESSESRCGVVNMHLPPRNDFQVVTTEIRSEVLSRVAACTILPLQFMNGTVSLVMPKSATR